MSELQTSEELRGRLSFYAGEAGRALLERNKQKARRRGVVRRTKRRRAILVSAMGNIPKWQADTKIENDRTIVKLNNQLEECDSLIEIVDGLYDTYLAYHTALSRELSARIKDKEMWQGRTGSGR